MTGQASASVPWRAVVPGFGAVTVAMLPAFLVAALAVQIADDIGLGVGAIGLVIGVFFATSALASTPMGAVVERIGWQWGTRIAALLAVVALGGVGLSETTGMLTIFLGVGGCAAAIAHPSVNVTVAACVPEARQGLLFGIKHVTVPTTTLLGGLAVPTLGLTVGWRWAFAVGAGLAALAASSVPPRDHRSGTNGAIRRRRSARPSLDLPLSLMVLLAAAAGLGIGAIDALASYIVTYSVDVGVAQSLAGLVLAGGSVAGIVMRLAAGWAVDRARSSDLTLVIWMLVLGAAGVAVISTGSLAGLWAGSLIAFLFGWGWSGLFTLAIVDDNPSAPARASGIGQTGMFVGAALGPPAFGFLVETGSFAMAWWATAGALLLAAALVAYARSRRRTVRRLAGAATS